MAIDGAKLSQRQVGALRECVQGGHFPRPRSPGARMIRDSLVARGFVAYRETGELTENGGAIWRYLITDEGRAALATHDAMQLRRRP
jgi:hypothetical protein